MSQARPERGARPLSLPAFAAVAVAGCLLLVGRSATRSLSGDAALWAVVLAVAGMGLGLMVPQRGHTRGRKRPGGDPVKRLAAFLTLVPIGLVSCSHNSVGPLVIGAVYPLNGSQGPGGRAEFKGVRLAVDMVNRSGGVDGRRGEVGGGDGPAPAAAAPRVDSPLQ